MRGGKPDISGAPTSKGLLACIASKLIAGLGISGEFSQPTQPSGIRKWANGEDETMEGDAGGASTNENSTGNEEQQRGRSPNRKRRNPNAENNNQNRGDEGDENGDDHDPYDLSEDDEFARLAAEAELLKVLLRLAEANKIDGSCTLLSSLKGNEVVLEFVAITHSTPPAKPRRGFVLYKLKESGVADLELKNHWKSPNRWVFVEVANKPFVIPSFLLQDFVRSTRLAHKKGTLSFQTAQNGSPLDTEKDDWEADLLTNRQAVSGIDERMSRLSISPQTVATSAAPSTPKPKPTAARNLFAKDAPAVEVSASPGSEGRSSPSKYETFKLFSAMYRSRSLDRKDQQFKMASSAFHPRPEDKWSLKSKIFFVRFCQNCWEEIVHFGHGPRTWLRYVQARLASDELQVLMPLFAFAGSYECHASNTVIESLKCPNPVDWVRCASVLIYDGRIAETRLREASMMRLKPGAKIIPFIQALERGYYIVGIHRNWSRDETRRHIIDRFTVETFGTDFMRLYIAAFQTPPSPKDYGMLKNKCKLIASQLEMQGPDSAPSVPGILTLMVGEDDSTAEKVTKPKESGKPVSEVAGPSDLKQFQNSMMQAVTSAMTNAMKAWGKQQTMLVAPTEKAEKSGGQRKRNAPVDPNAPKCPHCGFAHPYRKDADCWMNPSLPLSAIPQPKRAAIAAKRRTAAGKAKADGQSSITEMRE